MTTELIRDPQSGAGPEPPDPALLQAIRPSALRMADAEESFVQLLHEEIGNLAQHLQDHGWPFCERTARTILWLALSDQAADTVFQAVYWLAAANQADGFPPSEYVTVGHALVRTAREMSGADWTTTTGSAWIRFFMWLQPFLQADARQQAVHQQAVREQAVREQAVHQEAVREQAVREQAVREQAVREQAVREQAVHQEAVREQAVREQAAHQRAAYRQDSHQQGAREQAADPGTSRNAFDQARRPTVEVDVFAVPHRDAPA